jgi:ankyrin repeat protein
MTQRFRDSNFFKAMRKALGFGPKPEPDRAAGHSKERQQQIIRNFLEACMEGEQERIGMLLKLGADVNAGDSNTGRTPLIVAALNGRTEAAAFLLRKGADIDAKSDTGRTALMFAALSGINDVCVLLLENNADISATDKTGRTALKWALFNGEKKTARLLEIYYIKRMLGKEAAERFGLDFKACIGG